MIGKGPACVPDYLLIQATGWLIISPACIISRGLCHSRFRSNSKFHFTLIQSLMEWSPQIFCTCHNSTSVVACAKFCSNLAVKNWIMTKWIFLMSVENQYRDGQALEPYGCHQKSGLNTGHKKCHLSIYSNHFAVLHVVLQEYYSCPIILKLCPIEQRHNNTVGAMCKISKWSDLANGWVLFHKILKFKIDSGQISYIPQATLAFVYSDVKSWH